MTERAMAERAQRDAAIKACVQTWTRCRIPVEEEVSHPLEPMRRVLLKADGYGGSVAGRNVNDLDEVLIISGDTFANP